MRWTHSKFSNQYNNFASCIIYGNYYPEICKMLQNMRYVLHYSNFSNYVNSHTHQKFHSFTFFLYVPHKHHMCMLIRHVQGRCHTCQSFKYLLNFTHGCSNKKLWVSHYTSILRRSSSSLENLQKVVEVAMNSLHRQQCSLCFLPSQCSTSPLMRMNVLQLSPHLTIK